MSELSGKGTVLARAEDAGLELDPEAAKRAVERLKELEHRGYHFEAADASFDLLLRKEAGVYEPLFRLESFRVITDKREDGKVQTEATIKIWAGGERIVSTAEGNGPVNALDRALRDAIADMYPRLRDIDLVNYKVRIIDEHKGTGAVTRVLIDASDGHDTWGTIGVSENIIEASWEALVDSLEYAMQSRGAERERALSRSSALRTNRRRRSARSRSPTSASARRSWCWRCCDSGRLSLGPDARAFRAATSPPGSGSTTRSPYPAARRRCTSAVRAIGWGRGDEVVTSPFSFIASANCLLYEGVQARSSATSTPSRSTSTPQAAAAACGERTVGLLPVHVFGYPGDLPALEALAKARAWGSSRMPARRSARSIERASSWARRGNSATFAFYANKQLVTGEGGMLTSGSPDVLARARSERNQGRAADMGRIAHDRLGFNYRLSELAAALGIAQLERADAILAERARVASLYKERAGGGSGWDRRPRAAREDRAPERRSWFVYVVQLPDGVDRDAVIAGARGARDRSPRPTCPASTCSRSTGSVSASGRRVPGRRARSRAIARRCPSSTRWGSRRWSGFPGPCASPWAGRQLDEAAGAEPALVLGRSRPSRDRLARRRHSPGRPLPDGSGLSDLRLERLRADRARAALLRSSPRLRRALAREQAVPP